MNNKTNLSKAHKPVVNDRFYYGIAPRGEYFCKDCPNRHIGCHIDCPDYNAEKALDEKRKKEELKHRDPGFSKDRERKLIRKMKNDRRNK